MLLVAGCPAGASIPQPRPAIVPPAAFPFGVAWYPEWVPEAQWDADLDAMRTADITYVRVGEFAWSRMEPSEGRYDFGWLDRAIARAKAKGMRVLLGTPTAAPPAWLTSRYPDTLLVEADGRRAEHGGRRHFSVASRRYRVEAARIASALGRRYGHEPAVIGFQIDNEYGRDTYDAAILGDFRQWLKARYGTLARLNAAWFATYWSRTYTEWMQVAFPDAKYGNPPARLDWLRFLSDEWRSYQAVQIAALRPTLASDKIITTNFVAKYDEFDFSVPAQDLDIVGWDQYHEQPRLDPDEAALQHDLYRGFLGRNPWVLESTAQNIVYGDRNYTPPKGQMRAQIWQAVAHGADSYSIWPWQTPPGGNEVMHGAMVDTAGRPKLTFGEVAKTAGEIARAWPSLRGTTPVADTAILHDYPNRWLVKRDRLSVDYDPWDLLVRYHRAVAPAVGGIDVLRGVEKLAKYRLVVAPVLPIVDDATAAVLADYVTHGGHLLLGPRSGTRDSNAGVREPGAFERLLGARADAGETPSAPLLLSGSLGRATATIWAERLGASRPGLETLLRYDRADGWLDGAPAIVSRAVGRGRVTYVGAWLDDAGLALVAGWAAKAAGARPLWPGIPAGVEVTTRAVSSRKVTVAINWTKSVQRFAAPRPLRDLINGGSVGEIELAPFGVAAVVADR